VKTTLGLEQLRCQSPAMVRKELLAGLIAHNLIRCVLAEAAQVHAAELERLSFKGAVDALRQYSAVIAQARTKRCKRKLWQDLLRTLARDTVPRVPDAPSRALLNAAPNPFPYSIVHAENSSNSLIATAAGTADHANFKALTNRHSGLTPSWSDPFLISHYGLSRALKRVKNHYGDTDDRQYGCCNLVGDSPTLQISISIFLVVINISRQKHNTNA
jgi:hypothetical protein